MKQVIQNYRTGILEVVEVPAPSVRPGTILIRNLCSVVSSGTERMVVDMARKSLVGKALARPDLVRRVIDKVRADGLYEAFQQVWHRMDTPVPLGYSSAGEIIAVGDGISDLCVAQLVACGGQGVATHSEVVCVPCTLAAPVPAGLTPTEAAFGMVGAIALHAVRVVGAGAGDFVAVVGLGLLGLLAAQILKASGCRTVGIDIAPKKVDLARSLGVELAVCQGEADPVAMTRAATQGQGTDGVLITAATPSNAPIELAARLSRERGRIVATGLVGLSIPRQLFYEKELEFMVSRASGPGLYDPDYEQRGRDYPYPHVRWTHARNMAHFLEMVRVGQVRVDPLISRRFKVECASEAYEALMEKHSPGCVGIVLEYPRSAEVGPSRVRLLPESRRPTKGAVRLGVMGAGLFARTTLLPELCRLKGIALRYVAAASGASARHAAEKFGFAYATTDAQEIIADPEVDCVFVLTRHNLHARLLVDALGAGKDAFVEKPLALSLEELEAVVEAWRQSRGRVMVGFNRRHSPAAVAAQQFLASRGGPAVISCRVNAGEVPPKNWVNDPVEGGGRILGEVCHFVDLVQFLTNSHVVRVHGVAPRPGFTGPGDEDIAANLELADGSVASIVYTARGHRSMSRERVEIFSQGAACVIENFRVTRFFGLGRPKSVRTWRQDRGHRNELRVWIEALRQGDAAPVPFATYVAATLATFALAQAVRTASPVQVDLRLLERCEKQNPDCSS
jgi:predicted dehydrogenase/threonine dehydrogenase-like Zn-dependent dehydrogenase